MKPLFETTCQNQEDVMRRSFIPGATISLALFFGVAASAFSDATEEFHKTFPLRDGAEVRVSNISGKIELSVWDQSYADVLAVKKTSRDREELNRVSIEVRADGALDIETVYDSSRREGSFLDRMFDRMGSSPQVSVYYTVRIPRTAVVNRVKSVSGDIEIRDARAEGEVRSVSGNITLTGTQGVLDIHSTSGDVKVDSGTLRNVHTVSGDILLRSVRGDIQVQSTSGDILTEGTGGTVEAHTISGDMTISGLTLREATSTSGDIRINPTGFSDAVKLASVSGDITVRMPSSVNADLSMETVSGDLINRSNQSITATQISRRKISGRIGSGGNSIRVHTTSGDVVLE
jgi:DUF4097 and DUF4098 domain-containing protein YvlB